MSEIQNDLNKVKRNIEFHISIHHLGESAEVLKLDNCKIYKDLITEQFVLLEEYKNNLRDY